MKAPDKIYIDDLAVVNDCITKNSTKPIPNFSEYIRKDTLLEWAKKELENAEITDFDEFGRGEVIAYRRIVDKLNSM